jgi:glycosyltransferase involved in cell wall biosynthesis
MIPELFPELCGQNPHQNKRRLAETSDLILSISECTSRDIVAVYGLDRTKIVTTPLGIDPVEFTSSPTARNPFRRPYLLFVGQRAGYKNFARLVAALRPILTRHPTLSLAILGGPLTEHETTLLADTLTLARIHQANVPDFALSRIYREAELFVFPSEYEGFGIPLLEAFASGCPVAASRASSFPEVGGEAIEYFDPSSIDEISHAVDRVLLSSSRADALRALGAERVKLFPWTRTVEKTADAYRRLV